MQILPEGGRLPENYWSMSREERKAAEAKKLSEARKAAEEKRLAAEREENKKAIETLKQNVQQLQKQLDEKNAQPATEAVTEPTTVIPVQNGTGWQNAQ